ncbi:unnamed protein product, partial [Rotaria magnacalcarata]
MTVTYYLKFDVIVELFYAYSNKTDNTGSLLIFFCSLQQSFNLTSISLYFRHEFSLSIDLRYSIYRFQRLLSLYQKNNETLSISSSVKLNATLKKLLDSKQYKEALDLFDQKFEKCTDFTIDMAIKACTISKDYKRGFN